MMQALINESTLCPPHALEAIMTPLTPARRQQSSPETIFQRQWKTTPARYYNAPAVHQRCIQSSMAYSRPPSRPVQSLGRKGPDLPKEAGGRGCPMGTHKELLGFVLNGKDRTVQHLTQRKAAGVAADSAKLHKKNRVALHKFQSIVP